MRLALERLSSEQDIQHVLVMNRISRLLHKASFKQRQRKALHYSHKFVITDQDLHRS